VKQPFFILMIKTQIITARLSRQSCALKQKHE
jgi:hypothetical protein